MGAVPQTQDFEDLLANLVNDRDFRHIDKYLRRFNLFEAMGAVRGELRHSNFLSFVLSPTRSHGIGSDLLLQFIRAAIAKQPPIRREVRSIELMVADMDSAIIHHTSRARQYRSARGATAAQASRSRRKQD